MLTIKLLSAGSISISQSPDVVIGLMGSEVYQSVMAMTNATGEPLDALQQFPETFGAEGEILSEVMVLNIPRPDATGAPFAVLITDIPGRDPVEATGTNYQFLYAGDAAEVLNDNGIAIHQVK